MLSVGRSATKNSYELSHWADQLLIASCETVPAHQEGWDIVLSEGGQQCLENVQDVAPVRTQLSGIRAPCTRIQTHHGVK